MRRETLVLLSFICFLALFAGPHLTPGLRPSADVIHEVETSVDLDAYLQVTEESVKNLKPGFQKEILWQRPDLKSETKLSIVYIHGFSASRRDLSPILENVAQELDANLFFTRLNGHGLKDGSAFAGVKAQDWIDDAREALAVGRRIGERVVLVGMSTGALLSLFAALDEHEQTDIAALVLLSPNFGLPDWRLKFISGPLGPFLARVLIGPTRSFRVENEQHGDIWTTTYHTRGIASLMDLINGSRKLELGKLKTPVLVLYTDNDRVVDVGLIKKRFVELSHPKNKIINLRGATRHELAGNALAPEMNGLVEKEIISFIHSAQP